MKRFTRLQSRPTLHGARSYLQSRNFATNNENVDSAAKPQAQAQSETADVEKPGQDEFVFDQFKVNLDEKTISTAAGPLPISPLLDPNWREARTRGNVKARPDKSKLNRFQRQLYQNPFAQMLSAPVRSCYVSRTRVPGAFLQSFGLVRHPETNDVWWLPEAITQSAKNTASDKPAEEPQGSQAASTSDETAGSEAVAVNTASVAAELNEDTAAKPKKAYRYPSHVLARQDLLKGFFVPGGKYRGGHFRLASAPQVSNLAKSAIWREDMDTVILNLSRQQIMRDLLFLSELCENERRYLIRVNDPNETGSCVRRWSYLWLGEAKDQSPEVEAQESAPGHEKLEDGPAQYATLEIDGVPETEAIRPIYNLPRLLGADNVQRLRSESSILREGSLFLLRGQRSSKLNLRLWKFQGYMADYKPFAYTYSPSSAQPTGKRSVQDDEAVVSANYSGKTHNALQEATSPAASL
ncbi:hypothetical protein VMCG_10303 [Cytospora schulzeri]|uniref:Uncharacterized protein n=1 Tax=Cytospora schulzeri TaxID=448051 RepID=A0A423VCG2_9PEZI|nr:hypothetical protein VMCG_10303 [Valsa malicola]